jgi:hypothetical protein
MSSGKLGLRPNHSGEDRPISGAKRYPILLWLVLGMTSVSAPPVFGASGCPTFPYSCHIHCDQSGCYRDWECDSDGICVFSEHFTWDEIVVIWQVKGLGLQAGSPDQSTWQPAPDRSPSTAVPATPPDASARVNQAAMKLRSIIEQSAKVQPGLLSRGAPPKPAVFWSCGGPAGTCLACAGPECRFFVEACNNTGGVGAYDPGGQVGVCTTGS